METFPIKHSIARGLYHVNSFREIFSKNTQKILGKTKERPFGRPFRKLFYDFKGEIAMEPFPFATLSYISLPCQLFDVNFSKNFMQVISTEKRFVLFSIYP